MIRHAEEAADGYAREIIQDAPNLSEELTMGNIIAANNNIYGYIRVSTITQHDDRQWMAMDNFGVSREHIFVDKQSGKDFNRPAYVKLMAVLKPGDTLIVKSIDRLGRDYDEIIEQWRIITKEKKTAVVVLDLPLLDTRADRDLTGTLIADIVLQLLSYVAQTEREMNLQRTNEGLIAARKRGVRLGRIPKKPPTKFAGLRDAYNNKQISARKAAKILGVSHNTFLKWVKA